MAGTTGRRTWEVPTLVSWDLRGVGFRIPVSERSDGETLKTLK